MKVKSQPLTGASNDAWLRHCVILVYRPSLLPKFPKVAPVINLPNFYSLSLPQQLNCPDRCHFHLESSGDIIESPGYPGKYQPFADCKWTLEGPRGTNIILQVRKLTFCVSFVGLINSLCLIVLFCSGQV